MTLENQTHKTHTPRGLEHPHVFSRRRGVCQQSLGAVHLSYPVFVRLVSAELQLQLDLIHRSFWAQKALDGFSERHASDPSLVTYTSTM